MATDRTDGEYSCEDCEETFEHREKRNEHVREVHDGASEEEAEEGGSSDDAAATDTDAAGSTGSITVETNDSPSAAEPAEAAGPSVSDDDVRPDTDDENGDDP